MHDHARYTCACTTLTFVSLSVHISLRVCMVFLRVACLSVLVCATCPLVCLCFWCVCVCVCVCVQRVSGGVCNVSFGLSMFLGVLSFCLGVHDVGTLGFCQRARASCFSLYIVCVVFFVCTAIVLCMHCFSV